MAAPSRSPVCSTALVAAVRRATGPAARKRDEGRIGRGASSAQGRRNLAQQRQRILLGVLLGGLLATVNACWLCWLWDLRVRLTNRFEPSAPGQPAHEKMLGAMTAAALTVSSATCYGSYLLWMAALA